MKARETQCMIYLRNAIKEIEREELKKKFIKGRLERCIDILSKMYKERINNCKPVYNYLYHERTGNINKRKIK